ncbi:pseudouridine synthase [Aureibaculum sp. 2210JD6-5]|uniref:pseudouridine synthase n=1 Tax=Aureibaculum sp. 2210JD6-5 TaxID=3103957 RepID=UPI002AAD759C|nr:pseudouridine synthase [Aureibaculum sp. 2210JD6-5]MDY7394549.1 pseudouridine synthase [Aureibaculum sp. 2210JD6-5]
MAPKIHQHFKLYKPFGMLSQLSSNSERQLRKKRFLSELYNFPEGSMPIGRLDEKSEGLLLITTDGKLSDTINRSGIEKEYYAQLDGEITEEAIESIKSGMEIGFEGKKYLTKPCEVTKLKVSINLPEPDPKIRIGRHRPNSWVSIILTEGKFRQVRKMTAAAGFPTLRLVRVRIGNIKLDDLQKGEVLKVIDLNTLTQ